VPHNWVPKKIRADFMETCDGWECPKCLFWRYGKEKPSDNARSACGQTCEELMIRLVMVI
jgi:hypothetical protein